MKKLLVLPFLFLATELSAAKGDAVEGSMSCTVKSQKVMSISEGKAEEFSHYNDRFVVGDILELTYVSKPIERSIKVILKDRARDEAVINAVFRNENQISTYRDDVSFTFERDIETAFFNSDQLYYNNHFSSLQMSRYYKGDWQGMFVRAHPLSMAAQIFTLDCRQKNDVIDQFLEVIAEWPIKWPFGK